MRHSPVMRASLIGPALLPALALFGAATIAPCVAQDGPTVVPRSAGAHDKAAHSKAASTVAPRSVLARPAPASVQPAARNAIGVAVDRHEGVNQHVGDHGNFSDTGHMPLAGEHGITKFPGGDSANANRQMTHPFAKPITPTRSGIGGADLAHRVAAGAVIGGPATPAGGISGTSIRPKHSARP